MSRVKNPLPKKMDLLCPYDSVPTLNNRYLWNPGEITGFNLVVAHLSDDEILIAWVWKATVAGPSIIFDLREEYDAEWVSEKMDIKIKDAIGICQFARYLFPRFTFTAPQRLIPSGKIEP